MSSISNLGGRESLEIAVKLLYKHACIAELHWRLVEPLSGTNLPPYLLLFFDQRQICDVRANLQTANVIGRLTTNFGKTLTEKYSEIDNKVNKRRARSL